MRASGSQTASRTEGSPSAVASTRVSPAVPPARIASQAESWSSSPVWANPPRHTASAKATGTPASAVSWAMKSTSRLKACGRIRALSRMKTQTNAPYR